MKPDNSRISQAVDLGLQEHARYVCIGNGAASGLCEVLVKNGAIYITLIDADIVGAENLPRQQFTPDQVGLKKVFALRENLQRINPDVQVTAIPKRIQDLTNEENETVFTGTSIVLNMTDSFAAQAYGNELCIQYHLPGIWAGYYERSRCFEIVFYIPGVTSKFCCTVWPRYQAQTEAQEEIQVSSACNTGFHAMTLDGIAGMIALAIVHNDTEGYEFSNWFGKTWERNFIQFKTHPAYSSEPQNLFQRTFKNADGGSMPFQSIWRKPIPSEGICPVCSGR